MSGEEKIDIWNNKEKNQSKENQDKINEKNSQKLNLDSIKSNLLLGTYVSKGDTLGFVGSSGTTSLSHLHFDFKSIPNQWGNTTTAKYLNPNRLFDPTEHPHVLSKLDNAHIDYGTSINANENSNNEDNFVSNKLVNVKA